MTDYFAMDRASLEKEKRKLLAEYEKFKQKNLKLDMSRGKPAPNQMDLSLDLLKIDAYKDESGVDTRNYGNLEGCPEAQKFFAEMLGAKPEETFVGGNASLQLMYTAIDFGWRIGFPDSEKPWKDCGKIKFLCPSPGYDRHFRITESFGFELIIVPMTPQGPDMDVMEELVKDEDVKGVWCVPVYSNPDGYTYSDETVKRMASMKTGAKDFRIFWDNAYGVHHLYETEESCLNILDACKNAGTENRPLMFCSTSKITFAGAGVSAMAASKENIQAIGKYIFTTTIGFDKMNQLRHARYLKEVGLKNHMKRHAALIAPKFDKVIEILQKHFNDKKDIAKWTEPNGGYFISLFTPAGCAKRVVTLCKEAGVVLTGAGAAFPYGKDPDDSHIRIAPTFPPIEELEIAADLLCITTCLATVEKLLAG